MLEACGQWLQRKACQDYRATAVNHRALLLGSTISRCNKMHLCAGWGVQWRWEGEGPTRSGVMRSRMLFFIDGEWLRGKSWDEDVRDSYLKASGSSA